MSLNLNDPTLACSCNLEWLSSSGGLVSKTVKIKNVKIRIARNEFREIFLVVETKEAAHKWLLKNVSVHKNFTKEGKATIKFPEVPVNLYIYNAPPSELVVFLKILFIKITSFKSSPKTSVKDKLLSLKKHDIQEISPVNKKDLDRCKSSASSKRPAPTEVRDDKENKKLCIKSFASLTSEQQRVLDAVKTGRNIFFTGSAGSGKSFLLQQILKSLQPDVTVVTASTGSAACLIGGITLHSFAGIGNGSHPIERCIQLANRPFVQQNWRRCRHLIIDEISMIETALFDRIERVARAVRGNDKPFGGIQLIVSGDFLQLPPVSSADNKFCFMSKAWSNCDFSIFYLKNVHRQSDPEFVSLLNSIRFGNVTEDVVDTLKRTELQSIEKDGILATRLCCYTKEAKEINDHQLNRLETPSRTFIAKDSAELASKLLDECTPVEREIVLKEGCQVMLLKNISVSKGLVNGARGIIEKFVNGEPVVKFLSGFKHAVKYEKWTVKAANGAYHFRAQVPLKLAWAFSIHKSQGLTLDCVEMKLGNTFEAGQAYVALSRAKSLESIRVIGFQANQVWANPDVLKFYKKLISRRDEPTEFIPLGRSLSAPKKTARKKLELPLVNVC